MRSLDDARARWQITLDHATSLKSLSDSLKLENDVTACNLGLRSVCWKIFLLFQTTNVTGWSSALSDSRSAYTSLRQHFLRFIENPDELGSALDPLDDNQNSPWNTLRQDEEIRAEIYQDVERCMPEEPYFRQIETRRILLDVLFIFCKINQDVGYRQGMHELLAPILWVLDQDAVESGSEFQISSDSLLRVTLDRSYIEHDAFTLLSLIMRSAKSFYELGEPEKRVTAPSNGMSAPQQGASPIVERSKRIHEVFLAQVDPELATHLTSIEVLPQIFLIRWIRLLFGREFPFEELLTLWDRLFAEDPGLELVDMVCVAMLLRIRWQLLDANYSVALMLLLKYPPPESPHAPTSFVSDAIYLRDHFNTTGGAVIITKYSGKSPTATSSLARPSTPTSQSAHPSHPAASTKLPMSSPARFLQQQGNVGDLFQGAAKTLFERGERLGINQAVRDAVEEARKNINNMQASRANSTRAGNLPEVSRWSLDEGRSVPIPRTSAADLNARNRQLAGMLGTAVSELRAVTSEEDSEKETYVKAIQLAMAKVDFVKIYLEDSSLPLPAVASQQASQQPPSNFPESEPPSTSGPSTSLTKTTPQIVTQSLHSPGKTVAKVEVGDYLPDLQPAETKTSKNKASLSPRPSAPLPTRSSIAQSNFAWMLEPDISGTAEWQPSSSSNFLKSGRRPTSGASREKAAFLFGDDPEDSRVSSSKPTIVNNTGERFSMGDLKGSVSKLEPE